MIERFELDRHIARGFDRIAMNPIRWALVTAALAIVFGGTVFSLVEDRASMPDGWWWAFVSMTTVGYGDLAPQTTAVRFIAAFVILTGVLSTVIVGASLTARVTQRRLEQAGSTPELNDDIALVVTDLRAKADELEAIGTTLRRRENGEA